MLRWRPSCRATAGTQDGRGCEGVLLPSAPLSAYLAERFPVLPHQVLHHVFCVYVWCGPHGLVQKILHVLTGFFQNEIHDGQSCKVDFWVVELSDKYRYVWFSADLKIYIYTCNVEIIKWLTLRLCKKKALLQTGGTDITIIMDSKRGKGIISWFWKIVETSGWDS